MRRLKLIDAAQAQKFVPDVGDNRQDADPFHVLLRPIRMAEYLAIREAQIARLEHGASSLALARMQRDATIEAHVISVHGLEVVDGGAARVIRTGTELVELAADLSPEEDGALDQIFKEILRAGTVGTQEKKGSS